VSEYWGWLRAGRPAFDSQQRQSYYLHHHVHTGSEVHLPSVHWVPEEMRLERKVEHSLQFNSKVKNAWNYRSTPQYVFISWCLISAGRILPSSPLYVYNYSEEYVCFDASQVLEICLVSQRQISLIAASSNVSVF
jgi:hypothetical protein